jgi:hypothetical protein
MRISINTKFFTGTGTETNKNILPGPGPEKSDFAVPYLLQTLEDPIEFLKDFEGYL